MKQYHDLLKLVLEKGSKKTDRTGTGTISIFGYQMRFDLQEGFPLLTTKKTHFKSVAHELFWFIAGDTNTKYLKDHDVKIWDEWADSDGNLGPVYGRQWRDWETNEVESYSEDYAPNSFGIMLATKKPKFKGIDQLQQVIERIKTNPDCRRLIVSAWNVADIPKMALAPCHALFQFYVVDGRLSCQLYQRSADLFLGVPFNIASYALLTQMVAHVTGYEPGEFIHTFGDAHIYSNHFDQVTELLQREEFPLPTLKLNPLIKNITDFRWDDLTLENYKSHPAIKAPVAV